MLLYAGYVVLAVVLLVPSIRLLLSGKVPSALDGYFVGLSASYLFPLFTRGSSLYTGDLSGYLGPLVILLMYVSYVAAGSAMVPTFRRRGRHSNEKQSAAGNTGSTRALVSTITLCLIPVVLALYLHHRVGRDVLWREVYLYGSAAVQRYLQETGPLAFSLHLLNGLFIYRLAHGWGSRWRGFFTLVVAALWTGVVMFTGQIALAVLVGGAVLVLGCASQRVVALAVLAVVVSVAVVGYAVSLRVDPGLVGQALDSLRGVWTGSVDKLWVLRWAYERAGLGLLGSDVVPPAEGWKYGVLAYVPAGVMADRGNDTGRYVASALASSGVGDVPGSYVSRESFSGPSPAFSVGGPVEALLNLGYFGLFIHGLVYGALFGLAGAWARVSSDRALSSLLFVLAAGAAGTGLYVHLTAYALTLMGYALVREKQVLPVSSRADEAWFRALSGATDASNGGTGVSPGTTEDAVRDPDETIQSLLQPVAEAGGQAPGVDAAPAASSGTEMESEEPAPGDPEGGVLAEETAVRERWDLSTANGVEVLPQVPARNGFFREDTDEVDLLELLAILARRRNLIVTTVLAAVAAAVLFSVAMPRRYEVTTTILVRDVPQARAAGVTAQTLAAFAVSDQVLRTVSQDISLEVLRRSFSVKLDSTARVLTLTAAAEDASDAFFRAQKWLDGFTVEASRLIGVEPASEPLVKVFVAPSFPERPVSPRITLNVAVSLLLGLFVGSATAFALDAVEKVRRRAQ